MSVWIFRKQKRVLKHRIWTTYSFDTYLIGAQMLRVVVVIVGVKAFWRLKISLKHQLQLKYNILNGWVSTGDSQEGDSSCESEE